METQNWDNEIFKMYKLNKFGGHACFAKKNFGSEVMEGPGTQLFDHIAKVRSHRLNFHPLFFYLWIRYNNKKE